VIVPQKQTFTKPASLSHEQATSGRYPGKLLHAWQLLVVIGALKPEETVLIHNAGGGCPTLWG
jgi:NADPH:quinone reductase-like Zn-dependent oxidoreductase